MIAMALACAPELLIADEPTTALDVTIQAQVLELLRQLNRDTGTGIILITHDLGVVAEVCHKVAVMYLGHIVESATTKALFENPLHPYTQGLMASIPRITEEKVRLTTIEGTVPNPAGYHRGFVNFAAVAPGPWKNAATKSRIPWKRTGIWSVASFMNRGMEMEKPVNDIVLRVEHLKNIIPFPAASCPGKQIRQSGG